jgi:hypothetical protein
MQNTNSKMNHVLFYFIAKIGAYAHSYMDPMQKNTKMLWKRKIGRVRLLSYCMRQSIMFCDIFIQFNQIAAEIINKKKQ